MAKDENNSNPLLRAITVQDLIACRIQRGDITIYKRRGFATIRVKVMRNNTWVNPIVNIKDLELIAPYTLIARKRGRCVTVYASYSINHGQITLARLILGIKEDGIKVFHRNRNILDHRRSNLEAVSKGGERTPAPIKPAKKKRAKQKPVPKHPKNHYTGVWATMRNRVIDRSRGICELCNRKPFVDVHHKMPVRFFAKPADAHCMENLIAVCKTCHQEEHKKLRAQMPLFHAMLSSWRKKRK